MMIKTLFIISSLFTLFYFLKVLGKQIQFCEDKQYELKRQMDDIVNNNEKLYKEQDKLFWEMLDKVNKIQEEQIKKAKAEKYIGKIDNV